MSVHTSEGWIQPAVGGETPSKYTLCIYRQDPETGSNEPVTFNIQADVAVERFHSKDAPEKRTLTVEWTDIEQFVGSDRFRGSVGGGHIHIETNKGLKVKGEIVGGPSDRQTFVGVGTWTVA
jgi:hypothetical protein